MGASLLAIAMCQPTSMLDVMASSRASSLPQGSTGLAVNERCFRSGSPPATPVPAHRLHSTAQRPPGCR
ncbi:hypothetical protein C1C98_01295 [Pseudomonas ogarae]|uniref:DUF1534 domain-containing protein n=1 Tax=Pseudomonas ogarae (strain DSM 112162 / CECT 30235 / F113) TaxID=1114970 RepID=A0ABM6QSJ9_PSEO1|nr:hypothetical protein C1C98_01295 [Pseudomonas ogarae]